MFKVGDRVKCINNDNWTGCLTIGKGYTVSHVDSNDCWVSIVDDVNDLFEYDHSRFVLCNTEVTEQTATDMILPTDSKARKEIPLTTGLLDYFPRALAAVANASYQGNQQHHPDKPLHWDRSVSNDHADCILRHMVDRGKFDTDKIRHSAKLAWRALALLELELEQAEKENENV